MTTRAVSATYLQRNWGRVADAVKGGDHILVMEHGRPVLVLMPPKQYDALMRARAEMASRPEAPIDGFGSSEEGGTREQPHRTNEAE